ncbi:unnamed protein product [Oppiella nova]|uniref:RING-type domain-containing protein n=1 Tax=Oppiella nova TaxID=334625 RepID=A0A7R9MSX7_9ACAR|nr:unnamed protein product [Oppiella nova]CAG2183010.1 unnamed protein product [Oppiella nova]
MAGYERERTVDLSDLERDELSCSICQDLLNRPVVAQCCLQMFCKDCIHNWLDSSNTCPYDRKPLSVRELCRPPRLRSNEMFKVSETNNL